MNSVRTSIKRYQSELKNTSEIKNIPERIIGLEDAEEHISDVEDRVMETLKLNNRKEK